MWTRGRHATGTRGKSVQNRQRKTTMIAGSQHTSMTFRTRGRWRKHCLPTPDDGWETCWSRTKEARHENRQLNATTTRKSIHIYELSNPRMIERRIAYRTGAGLEDAGGGQTGGDGDEDGGFKKRNQRGTSNDIVAASLRSALRLSFPKEVLCGLHGLTEAN